MSISTATWQQLFSLAIQFKQLEPWKYMFESDVFAVELPNDQDTLYCTILGQGGEFLGIGLYEGEEGYYGLDLISSGDLNDNPLDAVLTQKCLMLNYSNKDELSEGDEAALKQVKFSFKGKNAYPTFYQYDPGYLPVNIDTEEQAQRFIHGLTCAVNLAEICKKNKAEIFPSDVDDPFLEMDELYTASTQDGGETWQWEWREMPEVMDEPEPEISEIFLKSQLAKVKINASKSWIMEMFTSPSPIQEEEGERPYFPMMILVADPETGTAITLEALKINELHTGFQQVFVKICKEAGYLPKNIHYGNIELEGFILPICDILGIEIEYNEEISEMMEEFLSFLNSDEFDNMN